MKQRMAKVLSCAVTLALWTGVVSVQAQEFGEGKVTINELINCGPTILNYLEREKALNEDATYAGMEDAIYWYYYRDIAERLGVFNKDNYTQIEITFDDNSGYIGYSVVYFLHTARWGKGMDHIYDFSDLSPLFKEGYLPYRSQDLYSCAYNMGSSDGTKPEAPQLYLALDHLLVSISVQGRTADRFDDIAGTDNSDLQSFPAGFITQHLILSGLEFDANIDEFRFDQETEWSLSGGSGFVPPGAKEDLIYITASDMLSKNFKMSPSRSETLLHSRLTVTHRDADYSLSLDVSRDKINDSDTTVMDMRGKLRFETLELGDRFSLRAASLTFDGSPNTAILNADMTRAKPTAEESKKEGGLTSQQKRWNRGDLNGTYYFSTEFFDGHIDGVPMKFHAPLSTLEGPPAQRFAVCNDSRVRVRGASNLDGEILGHLDIGDRVEILDSTTYTVQISDMNSYWYMVRRVSDNLIGWSYGYFLEIEE